MNMRRLTFLGILVLVGSLQTLVAQDAKNAVIGLIQSNYTARTFSDGKVSPDKIEMILQSGARAPSASNSQPWKFTVISDVNQTKKVVPASIEGNVLIIISGVDEKKIGRNVNFDCGLATENMYLAAQSLGLGAHIYTSPLRAISSAEAKKELKIPEGYNPVAVLRVGNVDTSIDATSTASKRNDFNDVVN